MKPETVRTSSLKDFDAGEHGVRVPLSTGLESARRRVLLALHQAEWPSGALLRASLLSRALDAELHVLRILPDPTSVLLFLRPFELADVKCIADENRRFLETTRAWMSTVLLAGGDPDQQRVVVRRGALIDEVSAHAAELGAELIVVAPHGGRFGALVEVLARTSGLPVWVAREARSDDTIVAATDLEDATYPVVRAATRLADRLRTSVVAVHNLRPRASHPRGPGGVLPSVDTVAEITKDKTERLSQLARQLRTKTDCVMRHDDSTADAILGEARRRDADAVMVGTREQAWFKRLSGGGVAARVVQQARRSVIVTPLPPVRASAHSFE